MARFQKSKSVSWPSDANLSQVKLFISEESPSLIGLSAQDHLQAKAWVNAKGAGSVDKSASGFNETNPAYSFHSKFYKIPVIKWRCPPKIIFDIMWQVVAGEESKEVESQNQWLLRVLEAVYPRPSAIPSKQEDFHDSNLHTPLVPITPVEEDDAETDTSFSNISQKAAPTSSQFQLCPPGAYDLESNSIRNLNPPTNFISPLETAVGVEPDLAAAAHTALSALMADNIDPDLLIKILRDPNIMGKLGSSHAASTNFHNLLNPRSEGISLPAPSEVHINRTESCASSLVTSPCPPSNMKKPRSECISLPAPLEVHIKRTETVGSSPVTFPCQPLHVKPGRVSNPHNMLNPGSEGISLPASSEVNINRTDTLPSLLATSCCQLLNSPVGRPEHAGNPIPPPSEPVIAASPIGAPVAKDINYYKSLIKEHGRETQKKPTQLNIKDVSRQSQEHVIYPRPRGLKPKTILKPCMFFNSKKGCRYGATCAYQHDLLSQKHRVDNLPYLQDAKRMKVDKEILKPCIFFNSKKGCKYGATCAYQHDLLSQKHRVDNLPYLQGAKGMKVNKEITGA